MYVHCIQKKIALEQNHNVLEFCLYGNAATTSCKNVETLWWKTDLSYFELLLVTYLWDIILTSIQSCYSRFWAWSCIANFLWYWEVGAHKHKIISQNKVQCLKYFYNCCTAVAAMIIEKSLIRVMADMQCNYMYNNRETLSAASYVQPHITSRVISL